MSFTSDDCHRRHVQLADLLPRYEHGLLAEEERRSFEAHLLECDRCFAELERGAAAAAELRRDAPAYLSLLDVDPQVSAPDIAPAASSRRGPDLRRSLAAGVRPWLAMPRLVPALVLFLVVTITITQLWRVGRDDFTHLASFPRDEIATTQVRGEESAATLGESEDPVPELLASGAAYFDLQRYEDAHRFFAAALQHDPHLQQAHYFLGLTFIFTDRLSEAIPHLEQAVVESEPALRPKVQWVLANAYLKDGRLEDARAVLGEVCAAEERGSGSYSELAANLLSKLP